MSYARTVPKRDHGTAPPEYIRVRRSPKPARNWAIAWLGVTLATIMACGTLFIALN